MHGEGWRRNLAALWFAQTLTMVAFSFVFPFLPLYIQTLGIPDTTQAAQWAGLVIAATAVSLAVAQPIWGSMADRLGRRPMVLRSMIGGAVTLGLMGLVSSVEQLLVLRFIQGAVTGTVAAANALAASSVPANRLGFALGIMQMALFSGISLGPLVGGLIADTWGFRVPFYAAAALMLIGFLVVLLFVRESFTPPPDGQARPGFWGGTRALLSIAAIPVLAGVIFLIQLSGVIVTPVLSLFIADLAGGANAASAAGVVLFGTGAMSAVSAIVLGRLGDRIGHTRILAVCLVGAGLACLPQGLVTQVWQLLVLRVLLGLFLGGLMPSANALLAQVVPRERRGAAFGLTAAATAMANAVGPLAGAAIATHWGMRAIFPATAAFFAVAVAWVRYGLGRHEFGRASKVEDVLVAKVAGSPGAVAPGREGPSPRGSGRRAPR